MFGKLNEMIEKVNPEDAKRAFDTVNNQVGGQLNALQNIDKGTVDTAQQKLTDIGQKDVADTLGKVHGLLNKNEQASPAATVTSNEAKTEE
jgi:hypothetical protein